MQFKKSYLSDVYFTIILFEIFYVIILWLDLLPN